MSLSLSSCRAACTNFLDSLSPFVPIVHGFRQALQTPSYVCTELLSIGSSLSSNTCSSMWWRPLENTVYKCVLTSPIMSRISYLDGFRDRRWVAIQLLSCEILLLKKIYIPDIGLAVRVFANGPGDLGSIPGRVIPKTQKMVLDASLLNTQHYKVRIKGKVEQSRERSSALPYTLV